jgi:hypothetical protein
MSSTDREAKAVVIASAASFFAGAMTGGNVVAVVVTNCALDHRFQRCTTRRKKVSSSTAAICEVLIWRSYGTGMGGYRPELSSLVSSECQAKPSSFTAR